MLWFHYTLVMFWEHFFWWALTALFSKHHFSLLVNFFFFCRAPPAATFFFFSRIFHAFCTHVRPNAVTPETQRPRKWTFQLICVWICGWHDTVCSSRKIFYKRAHTCDARSRQKLALVITLWSLFSGQRAVRGKYRRKPSCSLIEPLRAVESRSRKCSKT